LTRRLSRFYLAFINFIKVALMIGY